MKGRIDKIEERKKGDKPFWILSIGGDRYSVWKPDYMAGLEIGSNVEYTFSRKGNYRNIATLERLEPGAEGSTQDPQARTQNQAELGSVRTFEPEPDAPGDLIANMASLKYATSTAQNYEGDPLERTKLTLEIAETYRAYMRGEDYKGRLQELRKRFSQTQDSAQGERGEQTPF